jgi:hypothetical protein
MCAGSNECVEKAVRSGALGRALRVNLNEMQKDRLIARLGGGV